MRREEGRTRDKGEVVGRRERWRERERERKAAQRTDSKKKSFFFLLSTDRY